MFEGPEPGSREWSRWFGPCRRRCGGETSRSPPRRLSIAKDKCSVKHGTAAGQAIIMALMNPPHNMIEMQPPISSPLKKRTSDMAAR